MICNEFRFNYKIYVSFITYTLTQKLILDPSVATQIPEKSGRGQSFKIGFSSSAIRIESAGLRKSVL